MEREEKAARVARALELHKRGFNCAQAVACACADLAGIDEAVAFRMVEGLGGGMGCFSETCGAVSGACAIVGASVSEGPDNPRTKGSTYKLTRHIVESFRAQNGSTLCGEIKGLTGGPMLRSCPGCVEDATRLALHAFDLKM